MKKILILVILSITMIPIKCQFVIQEIDIYKLNIDSIENILSKFLNNQGDMLSIDNGVIFYDYYRDSLYFQYDSTLFIEKTERLFRFYSGMVHKYSYFLLTDKEKGYIINMKNSLDSILHQVNLIPTFSSEFFNYCSSQIKNVHYRNWEDKSDIKPTYMDEEGNYWEIKYDPNSW